MKQRIKKLFSQCGDWLRGGTAQPDDPGMEKYKAFYREELAEIKKNPEFYAHIFASDRFDQMVRDDERQWEETHGDSVSCDNIPAGNESERHQRTEQLIEMGKSYRSPSAEESFQREGPELGDD
jgi:hypothetical protein